MGRKRACRIGHTAQHDPHSPLPPVGRLGRTQMPPNHPSVHGPRQGTRALPLGFESPSRMGGARGPLRCPCAAMQASPASPVPSARTATGCAPPVHLMAIGGPRAISCAWHTYRLKCVAGTRWRAEHERVQMHREGAEPAPTAAQLTCALAATTRAAPRPGQRRSSPWSRRCHTTTSPVT